MNVDDTKNINKHGSQFDLPKYDYNMFDKLKFNQEFLTNSDHILGHLSENSKLRKSETQNCEWMRMGHTSKYVHLLWLGKKNTTNRSHGHMVTWSSLKQLGTPNPQNPLMNDACC